MRVCVGLFALLSGFPLAATAATYGGGAGTGDNPFLIQTAEHFALIGDNSADWDMHFKLVNDIDLSGYDETSLRPIGRWVMVGSTANQPFSGRFDGNGRTIRGFRYRDLKSPYVGLFQHVAGDIKDLHVARATVVADGAGAGVLVGYLEKGGVTGCSATGADVSGNEAVGALVGLVDGSLYACWSDGKVSGVRYVGGLVGRIGGGMVARSYSKAVVVGSESVGGLLGGASRETSIVDACYATGPVDGASYVGGLVGQMVAGRVFRCYAAGEVSGTEFAGGLVGYKRVLADEIGSLWDTEASTQATSVGGTGKTTAEMKSFDTYAAMNWDFGTTWTICEGVSYPILLWQIPVGDLRCPDGVNFTDFVWFAANWRHRDCGALNYSCDGADLDESGEVDPRDLALFSTNWLAGIDW
jgi:hypothetical protein